MKLRMGRAYARLGAAAAIAVAGSLVAAVPAFAADDTADLAVSVATTAVVAGTGTGTAIAKPVQVTVTNNGPATATAVKVTIDTTGLDTGKVKVELPDSAAGCTNTGTVSVCDLAEILPGGHGKTSFLVTGTQAGDAGSFTVSVASATTDPDTANNEVTQPLTVLPAEPASVDLVALAQDVYGDYSTKAGVPPGGSAPLFFTFVNSGDQVAEGIDFDVTLPEYVSFAKLPYYCKVTGNVAACQRGDLEVPTGGAASIGKYEFVLKVAADAPGPMALTGGLVDVRTSSVGTGSPLRVNAPGFTVRPATGDELADADKGDNSDAFSVFDAPSHKVDLYARTSPVDGAVGATVKLPVTIGNKSAAEAPGAVLTLVAPSGTQVVGGTEGCTAATPGRKYVCKVGTVPGEVEASGDFTLKILSTTIGTDGFVSFTSDAPDANPADNTAKIVITVSGGEGGGLPITGAKAGLIGGVGGTVLLAGVGALFMARRRRVVMVTPTDGAGE